MTVTSGKYTYEIVEEWAKLPPDWSFRDVVGVAVDLKSQVYVFNRGIHPMMVFDREGNFLMSWGEGLFSTPHSMRVGPDDLVYCVDCGDHTVRKLTSEGEVLLTLGTKNRSSDTGVIGDDFRTIKRVAGPFNQPTDVAFGPSGELYVSDGYGNARVHKFSKDGELLFSFGEPGDEPGQFHVPHSIWIDKQSRLYVADRENSRIQVFTLEGEFISQWKDIRRPSCIYMDDEENVYICEMGYFKEVCFPGMTAPPDTDPLPRVTIRSLDGVLLAQWGGEDRCAPGNFYAPHTICVDSKGDIYVGEVTFATGAPPGCHALQKFAAKCP